MHSAVYWVGFQGTDISVPYETLSLRTSPQAGVAISKNDVITGDSQEVNCRKAAREATLGCTSLRAGSE